MSLAPIQSIENLPVSSTVSDSPIPTEIRWLILRWTSPGKLNPWLGPALRGMTLYPLRRSLCLLREDGFADPPVAGDPRTDARRCRNCRLMQTCSYGQSMEPDLKILQRPFHQGNRDGMRGITFGTALQRKTQATVGDQAFVRLMGVGSWSVDIMPKVIQTLRSVGRKRGLGPDHVRFDLQTVDQVSESYALRSADFTGVDTEDPAVIPRLKITMDSPLVAAKKWGHQPPNFQQIAMTAIQTVSRAVLQYSNDNFDQVNFHDLKLAAGKVQSSVSDWQSEKYGRSSSRQEVRWNMRSWLGTSVFNNVPVAFLPWLQWGSILGVGDSRNCGAGLWTLQL